jgi:NAD(P)-dependent dehydrogenase (short-subunit alcohol dehydrogenase family)
MNAKRLEGKRAVITGAAGGMAIATALEVASQGA